MDASVVRASIKCEVGMRSLLADSSVVGLEVTLLSYEEQKYIDVEFALTV